jgi:WD40 repeat protein
MQTDVLSAHLNQSGVLVPFRTRLKGIISTGTNAAGTIDIWDSTAGAVSATYGRSGFVVTVTKSTHGLKVGDYVGIVFGAGGGTNGNYQIKTVADANTFTVTDINTGTVAPGTACTYNTRWLMSYDTNANNDVVMLDMPGEGIVARNGVYATLTDQTSLTIFYG